MNIPPWQFQRAYTPELIRRLLLITTVVTLGAVALDPWLGLTHILALNPNFYAHFFFWQPITSLFILPAAGFSFGFLLDFAFLMLVFWLFGSIVLERIGKTKFLFCYFASGILSGLAALSVMREFQLMYVTSELMPMILAITTLWAMIDPYQEILLFFVLPLKAKWVLVVALLGTLFSNLVQQDIVAFTAYFVAFIFSYFWGLIALGLRSPFDWMTGLDRLLNRFKTGFSRFWQWYIVGPVRKFNEKQKANENAFVDATLDKISKEGESSLSLYARCRLKWISFKRKLHNRVK